MITISVKEAGITDGQRKDVFPEIARRRGLDIMKFRELVM